MGLLCLFRPCAPASAQMMAFSKSKEAPSAVRQTQTLQQVLRNLESKHSIYFMYESDKIKEMPVDSKIMSGESIEVMLDRVLKSNGLDYKKHGKIYAIFPKDSNSKTGKSGAKSTGIFPSGESNSETSSQSVESIHQTADDIKITGKVTDDKGEPIPGVNILIKGSLAGTTTDTDGGYSIHVPSKESVLIFSFLGFVSQHITVGNQAMLEVKLATDTKMLSEVVVTALGFKEAADRLGSTSSKVSGEAIAKSGETSLINGLAGKAAGVQISRASSDPGAASFIQIRGQNTLTGNTQPLVVVDGIPISSTTEGGTSGGVSPQSRLNDINPNDIASMQILKGASAAALWGSRAANGVILITTKRGAEGKMNI